MKKGTSTGPNICSICKRKKEVAIRGQIEKGTTCGHNKCTFEKEIQAVLLAQKKVTILSPLVKTKCKIKILSPITPQQDGKQD